MNPSNAVVAYLDLLVGTTRRSMTKQVLLSAQVAVFGHVLLRVTVSPLLLNLADAG